MLLNAKGTERPAWRLLSKQTAGNWQPRGGGGAVGGWGSLICKRDAQRQSSERGHTFLGIGLST